MAVLVTFQLEASKDQYDAVNDAMDPRNDSPEGLIAHTSQDMGGSMKIIDVWESAEAFGAFAEGRLAPVIAETLGDDAPPPPQPEFTELYNAFKG